MTTTQTVYAVFHTLCFVSLFAYIMLINTRYAPILLRRANEIELVGWAVMCFFFIVVIGFLLFSYEGALTMLGWMPDDWGYVTDEDDYVPWREIVAAVFAIIGTFTFISFISTYGAFPPEEQNAPSSPC